MPPPNRPPFSRFDRRPPPSPRKRMLAQGRKAHFVYDMRALLAKTKVEEAHHRAFIEALFSRGSRGSTEEAKDFLETKLDDGTFTLDEANAILDLLERYSFWR